jgi:hypothetical protein
MPIPPSLFIVTTNEAVLFTYWSAARFTVRSGPPYKSGNLFSFNDLTDQKRTHSHGHRMESQRTDKSTEIGDPLRTGEDPSHHIHDSDKAKHQQQDTDNP